MGPLAARSRAALTTALAVVVVLAGVPSVASAVPAQTAARESWGAIARAKTFRAPGTVSHFAVHWRGHRKARVRVALSRDGRYFGTRRVELDEVAESAPRRETYGAVMLARRVRAVRVYTDRRLGHATVLWLTDRGSPVRRRASAATLHSRRWYPASTGAPTSRFVSTRRGRRSGLPPLSGAEADRPPHGDPEPRPGSRSHREVDLLLPLGHAGMGRRRLQLPDRRGGAHL
jgi:hypothetical protein